MEPFITLSILIGIALLAILAIFIFKYKKIDHQEPNYYTLFILGIIFTGAGAAMFTTLGPAGGGLFILGIIYLIIGLANKHKWKPEQIPKQLDKNTRNLVIILVALILLAIILALLFTSGFISL